MKISKDDLGKILARFNPWWREDTISELPEWHRASFGEFFSWVSDPPVHRAVLLTGARQIGKTTLMLQAVSQLLKRGIPRSNILYATFDHPLLKLAGADDVLEVWHEREPVSNAPEFLFLDEAQFIRDWGTWIKHQVDFQKNRHIAFTGSAMPLAEANQESGVGRWHTIRLGTLSFYEYIQLREIDLPSLPEVRSFQELRDWPITKFRRISETSVSYVPHFHEYLVRGGFPQTAQIESVEQAQRILREDIIDKVLKRDMTALFGVRRILELEQTFLYLCMHDGGLLDMVNLCDNLQVKRPTAQHFIDILEAAHLIYRLPPLGYGKEVLRGRFKIYLTDAAIASAVLLKGRSIIDDPTSLGIATETSVFKHIFARVTGQNIRFSYWRGKKDHEVDLIAETGKTLISFEVKYRAEHIGVRELQGFYEFLEQKGCDRGYVVTKSLHDFGVVSSPSGTKASVIQIPAPLLCYWLGESEINQRIDDITV
ncbi:MAG: ATP-binding protein [Leptospirales bacterium]